MTAQLALGVAGLPAGAPAPPRPRPRQKLREHCPAVRGMMAYVGEATCKRIDAHLDAGGYGQVILRGRVGKARLNGRRWFYDNGAFRDWRSGVPFDAPAFEADILAILDLAPRERPDFVVLPDRVAAGLESLGMSLAWLHRLGRLSLRYALVVQDGMRADDIPWEAPFDVLFVGGSLDWKLQTAQLWIHAAHEHGRVCHVGRVGTGRRVRWALDLAADSIDSSLPLWSVDKLDIFTAAVASPQRRWFW
jgi:hypothetical protein